MTIIRRCCLVCALAAMTFATPARPAALDAASPKELIAVLKANVYLTGDIVKRLAAQKRLERLGRQNPKAVVPLIVKELSPPRSYGKIAGHQRLALIELLRDIGAAAEPGVPVLMDILNDREEPYESVKTQAAAALGRIGTADARAAADAYYAGLQRDFAGTATRNETTRSVEQSAYLIRQQLRNRRPSDGVIAASVAGLSALGPRAAPALPTLLRAYGDRRLGSALHRRIGRAIRAAGVRDVEAAAARAAAASGVPDILAEIIAETRHRDQFVRSLAMGELGKLGASEPAIEAMISALRAGRNPGDAARILGDMGKPAARALPQIARYFDDERAGPNAMQAVGKIGVRDQAVIAGLRRVLATRGHRHRGMAASALGRLKAVEALPELQQSLSRGGKYDRILSAKALGRMGSAAAPAVAALAAALGQPDLDLRRAAVVALGQIGDAAASAAPVIAEQLNSGNRRLKNAARHTLTKIGGPVADVALQEDASRFAKADLAESRRLAATHGMKGLFKYLFRLPERRAQPLATRLLAERQPDSAYVGALFVAHRGDMDRAIPILADNLARRPGTENLFIGLAVSTRHGGDVSRTRQLFQGLDKYFQDNRGRYTPEEQARLEALLRRLGAGRIRR